MDAALIGLVGLLVGALLNEHFRRKNRIEVYSQKTFERRLEVFETLMKLLHEAHSAAEEAISSEQLSPNERKKLLDSAVLPLAGFCDTNQLYIDSYVASHVVGVFVGADDVQSIADVAERESSIAEYRSYFRSATEMVRKESGVEEIDAHFRLVSRSQPDSPLIRRIKELEREKGVK